MSFTTWVDTCSLCDGTRFWPSRFNYKVCMTCCPDPLEALIILARRSGATAVKRAERWAAAEVREEIGQKDTCTLEFNGVVGLAV
jgi:hypothetical protein